MDIWRAKKLRWTSGALSSIGFLFGFATAVSAEWQIPEDPGGRTEIRFIEAKNKKAVFSLACGHNVVLLLRYTGKPNHKSGALVTIRNLSTSIAVRGRVKRLKDHKDLMFIAVWAGRGDDPADLKAFAELISNGEALTFRAGRSSYVLPPINKKLFKRFDDDC